MQIVPATQSHHDAIWEIFRQVTEAGDSYTFDSSFSKEEALSYWTAPGTHPYVAVSEGRVIGSYILRPNHPGRGSHVANASYMVCPSARGLGTGSALCTHSIDEARRLGFLAMQFNIVVSNNAAAVHLWQKHGFKIVGTLPKVYRHRDLGFVDAFVMHRFL